MQIFQVVFKSIANVQCSKHFCTRVQNWIFECRCPLNLRGFCWCRVTDGWMRGWAARPVNQPRNRLRVASSHSNFHHLIEESERIFITSDICLYVWVFECLWMCACVCVCVRPNGETESKRYIWRRKNRKEWLQIQILSKICYAKNVDIFVSNKISLNSTSFKHWFCFLLQ